MHYVKIWDTILDGSLADDFTTRHIFEDLLKLMDAEGVVDMTPAAIAARIRVPVETVRDSIAKLEREDPESRNPDSEGRRIVRLDPWRSWGWKVVNAGFYRGLRSAEDQRRQTRERTAKWRAKKGGPDSSLPHPVTHQRVTRVTDRVTNQHRSVTASHVTLGDAKKEEGGKRQEEATEDRRRSSPVPLAIQPPIHSNVGADLAPLEPRPPSEDPKTLSIPVRVKPRSAEIREEPISEAQLADLEREYAHAMNLGAELVDARRWCLREAAKPRRGKLPAAAIPFLHNWLRKASKDARARASPAASARGAADRAYRAANKPGARAAPTPLEAGAGDTGDLIAEHLGNGGGS